MASIAAFVYFWSSAYEVSGGCATDTLYPSFLRISATLFQPEPSAKAPCTKTTFLICCVMIIFPLWFELLRVVYRAADLRPTIVRNELSVIENMNHFCRFLLKCVKAAIKTTPSWSSTREL